MKQLRVFLILSFVLLLSQYAYSQETRFAVDLIPENLKNGASAVVRIDRMQIDIASVNQFSLNSRRAVTVFNTSGFDAVLSAASYDPNKILTKLEARIYDASGTLIETIEQKDFYDAAAVDGISIYHDNRLKYFNYTPTKFPITIDFRYQQSIQNSTAFIPRWNPLEQHGVNIELSEYKLTYPETANVSHITYNFENYDILSANAPGTIQYSLVNYISPPEEQLEPAAHRIAPSVVAKLDRFTLVGIQGDLMDWGQFAKWQYKNLLANRDQLPETTKRKIAQLVVGIEDPEAKARVIYKYVQDNTRYISVQLGIGGWMPELASEVDRLKYGDCKGLTNYTKALLASQGIESNYAVVWAGEEKQNIDPDFTSFSGNHVILNVPFKDKEVWLECTNQRVPFGYLGSFTDNREVLLVSPNGGDIVSTVAYPDSLNITKVRAQFDVLNNGDLHGDLKITSTGINYEQRFWLTTQNIDQQSVFYKTLWPELTSLSLAAASYSDDREKIVFKEDIALINERYGITSENEMRLRLNPLAANDLVPSRYRTRTKPFEILRGSVQESEYYIKLPVGFGLQNLPDSVGIENIFGTYDLSFESLEENTIKLTRKLFIREGFYSKEKYNDYRNFMRAVQRGDKTSVILSKQ
ncbi:MAG: DUF3857 domain-containing protein [Gilvibacter sp.]